MYFELDSALFSQLENLQRLIDEAHLDQASKLVDQLLAEIGIVIPPGSGCDRPALRSPNDLQLTEKLAIAVCALRCVSSLCIKINLNADATFPIDNLDQARLALSLLHASVLSFGNWAHSLTEDESAFLRSLEMAIAGLSKLPYTAQKFGIRVTGNGRIGVSNKGRRLAWRAFTLLSGLTPNLESVSWPKSDFFSTKIHELQTSVMRDADTQDETDLFGQ